MQKYASASQPPPPHSSIADPETAPFCRNWFFKQQGGIMSLHSGQKGSNKWYVFVIWANYLWVQFVCNSSKKMKQFEDFKWIQTKKKKKLVVMIILIKSCFGSLTEKRIKRLVPTVLNFILYPFSQPTLYTVLYWCCFHCTAGCFNPHLSHLSQCLHFLFNEDSNAQEEGLHFAFTSSSKDTYSIGLCIRVAIIGKTGKTMVLPRFYRK